MPNINVVSGLGRCGASLVMSMLFAAGMSVAADEPYQNWDSELALKPGRLSDPPDKSFGLKVLFPMCRSLPQGEHIRVLWLERDLKSQSLSFLREAAKQGLDFSTDPAFILPHMVLTFTENATKTLIHLKKHHPVLILNYEHLIHPTRHEGAIAQICGFFDIPLSKAPLMSAQINFGGAGHA